ncbi:piggyBac transposable element-derived protein 4 [Trichonephila clavipes]|nr:piggyBac transposable element-derived protein 4 [Trichonephila clavipes]
MGRLISILIFYFLTDLAIINSFILWQVNNHNSNRSLDQLTYRIALARQLIDGYFSTKKKRLSASFQAKKCAVSIYVRLDSVGNRMPKKVSNYRKQNVAERDEKKGQVTYVKNVISSCAMQHASHLFMANNHH